MTSKARMKADLHLHRYTELNVDITTTKPTARPTLRGRHILRAIGLIARGYLPAGMKALAHWTVALSRHPRVTWGAQTLVGPHVLLDTSQNGSIKFGRHVTVSTGAKIVTYGGSIELGDYVGLNYQAVILGNGPIVIGRDTL